MPVLFGDRHDDNGWLRVTVINYKADRAEGGFVIDADDIPPYPETKRRGKRYLQLYNPVKNEWRYDEVDAPYTEPEALLEIADAIRELAEAIKEK